MEKPSYNGVNSHGRLNRHRDVTKRNLHCVLYTSGLWVRQRLVTITGFINASDGRPVCSLFGNRL